MKTAVILILVLVLTAGLLTGCRPESPAGSIATEVSDAASEMMPTNNHGDATDSDGFIGEDNQPSKRSGFTPICN